MSEDAKVTSLLKQAAYRNDPDAQYELGTLYHTGQRGLPEDHNEAKRLICLAARQGHQRAREWVEAFGPSDPIAKWLYVRGGVWDKFRKGIMSAMLGPAQR